MKNSESVVVVSCNFPAKRQEEREGGGGGEDFLQSFGLI